MKPIPAIVQLAVDVERVAEQIIVALNEERTLDAKIVTLQGQLGEKRLAIGKLLREARPEWPERGPRANGWSDFLARVGLNKVTAWRYMELAVSFTEKETPDAPGSIPTYKELGLDNRPREVERAAPAPPADPGPDLDPEIEMLRQNAAAVLAAPVDAAPVQPPVNALGGSRDPLRGTYCTPEGIANAVGSWDLDPFTNPRSHVVATDMCMLERGDDGLLDLAQPGTYYLASEREQRVATSKTRVWIQPPYNIVLDAIEHYGHTRFCAFLRFDPSTEWFERLIARTAVVCVPVERVEFEAPPGIDTSANPYPHALYYACEDDITAEIRSMCIVLRIERAA